MTDDTRGTLHQLFHVRPPQDVRIPNLEPELHTRTRQSREQSTEANLRFKRQNGRRAGGRPSWIRKVDTPMKRMLATVTFAVAGLMTVGSAIARLELQSQSAS